MSAGMDPSHLQVLAPHFLTKVDCAKREVQPPDAAHRTRPDRYDFFIADGRIFA
jgi:hypothetical protein